VVEKEKVMKLSKEIVIYVDCDGVLLDGSHDDLFISKCKEKEMGYKLVLWTNRGECQVEMTKSNLGIYWEMFDDHMFLDGGKRNLDSVEGFIIEDSVKNGELGVYGYKHVSFRK
jgi:hypothetical protein